MKFMIPMVLVATLATQIAFAEQVKFTCKGEGDTFSATYETEPVDPENAVGEFNLLSNAEFKSDLYINTDSAVSGPKGTTLISIPSYGDGDTEFFSIAIPNSVDTLKKGAKFSLEMIELSDRLDRATNPNGVKRIAYSCVLK